jgi:AraC family transcriptional regulator, melibiose operon regulatory protein
VNSDDYLLSKLMSEALLPPAISTLGVMTSKPGYKFDNHVYADEIEIVYVMHGASFVGINNQFIRIKKNDCLLIFPRVTHNYFLKENESCKIIDLVFKPGDTRFLTALDLEHKLRFLMELGDPHMDYLRFVDNGQIRSTLEHILFHAENSSSSSYMLLKIYFCELYILLSKMMNETVGESGKAKNRYVTQGLDYLQNFYSSHLSADAVARQVGLSPRHFSRLFAQELGMSVPDYISILRINKAKDLLKNSDMDITGIAYNLGFNSSQYFTTCFKRIEHVTPKTYRNQVRGYH